ncbi:DPP IV N-terminal domain-containing protein [Flavobacteriaceae bacterium]|nr:DPP IV N-terminal domain-containing protein [Flavobacteriaceae bacterium]
MKNIKLSILLLLVFSLVINTHNAQENNEHTLLERYKTANEIQKAAYEKVVLNGVIYPHWIGETDKFWYGKETVNGQEYILVDATNQKRSRLFDHNDLANKLMSLTGKEVNSEDLSLKEFKVTPNLDLVFFNAFGNYWRYNLDDSSLEKIINDDYLKSDQVVSPDGKKGAFFKGYNLWLRDFSTGGEKQLTFDGMENYGYGFDVQAPGRPALKPNVIWSHDSKKILVHQTDDRQVKDLPIIDFAPADGSVRPKLLNYKTALPGDDNVTLFRMAAINVETGKQVSAQYPALPAVRMNDTPISGNRAWWHKDNTNVYFVDIERGEKKVNLIKFNTQTGKTNVVFSEETEKGYLELGSNVYTPTSLVYIPETNEMIWYSERSGFAHLYLYDLNTGNLKREITTGKWLVRDVLGYDKERREVFISRGEVSAKIDPYYRQNARVNIDNGRLKELSKGNKDHYVLHKSDFGVMIRAFTEGDDPNNLSGVSPTGNYFIETQQKMDIPSKTVLKDKNGKELMVIEEMNASKLNLKVWPKPFQVMGADGKTKISGVMFYPSDFSKDKKYPIVDHIYGGPQVSYVPESISNSSFSNSQSLAELGFIVVMIDGRGTTERSRAFHEASYKAAHTASNLEDHIAGIKQLAQKYPYLDVENVGIFGFSGGGYMTANAMLRFPEFYKVGVSGAGNHDQRLFWHSWGERYHGLMEGNNYLSQANLTYANNLKGKLLFIHGMMDHGVHPGGLFQLTQALMDANKDFDMVLMPRAAHSLPSYALRKKWDYFVTHLAKQQPPKNVKVKSATDGLFEAFGKKAALHAPLPDVINCTIETTEGDIELELYGKKAPITVANFLKYVDNKKFDGTNFLRVTTKKNEAEREYPIEVIQGGFVEPNDSYPGILLETTEEAGISHETGVISMARAEPDTAQSSFFICMKDEPELDFAGKRNPDGQGFAAFGKVIKGMDILKKIHQSGSDENQLLKKPVNILSIERTK